MAASWQEAYTPVAAAGLVRFGDTELGGSVLAARPLPRGTEFMHLPYAHILSEEYALNKTPHGEAIRVVLGYQTGART
jgi:hypothetical protein